MQGVSLSRAVLFLLFLFLLFSGLYYAKSFLIPIAFAGLLSMLLLPVAEWLEKKGMGKVISIILAILVIVLFFAGVIWLISWQLSDIMKDSESINQNLTKKVTELRNYISSSLGISKPKQEEVMAKQQSEAGGSGIAGKILSGLGGFVTNLLLVLIYIFLFMFFRTHLKKFILQLVPKTDIPKTEEVITKCRTIAQKYITGLGMMIVCLWVMYGIGFSIAGVKSPILFAVLCGVLEIIPFVGNLAGTTITLLMTIAQGGGTNIIIGILITYALVQFIQSYIIEPLVVGAEVNINPLITIMGIVLGELVWGIPGMILAVPFLGIIKIICDNVQGLKPYGLVLGQEKEKKNK
jgi:predicted PurR-regulated permease PerM